MLLEIMRGIFEWMRGMLRLAADFFYNKGFFYLGSDHAGPLTYGAHLTRTYTTGTVSYLVYNWFIRN